MIHQYIKELIKQDSRLILPDLGAFLTKELDGVKTIFFNDVLKFNDGALVNYISEKDSISNDEAINIVTNYIKKINNNLIENGFFDISGLGKIYKDNKGYLNFQSFDNTVETEEKTETEELFEIGNAEIIIEKIEEDVESNISENKKLDNDILDIIDDNNEVSAPQQFVEENKIEHKSSSNEVKIEESNLVEFKINDEPIIEKGEIDSENKIKKELNKTANTKKKSSKAIIITLAIVIPLALIIASGFLFKSKLIVFYHDFTSNKEPKKELVENKKIINKKLKKDAIKKEIIDSTKNTSNGTKDTIMVEKVIENIKAESKEDANNAIIESKSSSSFNVHTIAGSFNSMKEAEKYSKILKNKGYQNSKVLDSGTGKFRVTFNSYQTRDEANNDLQKITSTGVQSWILNQ